MQVFANTEIDFMGRRKLAIAISVLLLVVSVGSLATRGLNLGIDFTGGVLLEVAYSQAADLETIRGSLAAAGFGDAQVQNFGTARDVLIRVLPRENTDGVNVGESIRRILEQNAPSVELRRNEFVGPQVGEDLTEQGGLAMLFALLMILAYVAFRFQWKFAVGSVAALIHDVTLTIGIFSILQKPFDLSVLAAVLAVIGYSLNDTIVVFDRIRENFIRIRRASPVGIMNRSINQMLARTLTTSMTTLLVLFALLFLGGQAVNSFAFALIIGVVVGTYSSIYVASTTALALDVTTTDLMPPQKTERDDDGMP